MKKSKGEQLITSNNCLQDGEYQSQHDNHATEVFSSNSTYQAKHWVLLRGLGRDQRHWGTFYPQFKQHFAKDKHSVVDTLGNGEWSRYKSPLVITQYTDHCRKQLLQTQPEQRHGIRFDNQALEAQPENSIHQKPLFYLVALSLGGMIALDWSKRFPNEIGGVILINSSAANLTSWYQRINVMTLAKLMIKICGGKIFSWKKHHIEHAILLATSNNQLCPKQVDLWEGFRQQYHTSLENLCRQLLAASRFYVPKGLTTSPLILTSKNDRLVSSVASKQLHQHLGGKLAVHSSAGHDLPLDDAAWVISQIEGYFN